MARRDDLWLRDLYQAQWAPMVQLATLLLGSSQTAADVVADALLAVDQRQGHFESFDQAQQYLRVAVLNRTRSTKRPLAPSADWPQVITMMAALPQRQREVLVLRHYLALDDRDIASTLGISRTAVTSHAQRGLHTIQDMLPRADDAATIIAQALQERADAVDPPERLAEVLAAANRSAGGRPRRLRFRWMVVAALVALLTGLTLPVLVPQLSLLGRVSPSVPPPTVTATHSPNVAPSLPTMQRDLPIYYVGTDHRLYREFRDLPTQDDRLATAVGAVLNVAPLDSSYSSLWAGGQVNSATVMGSRIVIDISAPAFATFTTRALADAAINQVVYTAIGAVGDQTGGRTVQILIDGSPNLPVIGAPTSDFTRSGTTPLGLLWILTPMPATPVAAGELVIRGYQQAVLADTTINWQVLNSDEKVIREGRVAATGNDGGWRSWVAAVVLPAGEFELRVWTSEAPEQRRHFTVA